MLAGTGLTGSNFGDISDLTELQFLYVFCFGFCLFVSSLIYLLGANLKDHLLFKFGENFFLIKFLDAGIFQTTLV